MTKWLFRGTMKRKLIKEKKMQSENKKIFEGLMSKVRVYLVIIAILLILLCINNIAFIVPSVFVYAILLVYAYYTNQKKKTELNEHIKELTINVDKAAKNTLIHSPFPLMILGVDGNIIWKSIKFNETFGNVDIATQLSEMRKEVKTEMNALEAGEKREWNTQIEVQDKKYKVIGEVFASKENRGKEKSQQMTILYFIDDTEYMDLQQEHADSNLCVGILNIDNYEELMQSIAEADKPQVIAQIEKLLYNWATEHEGLMIKSERDFFTCTFEQKALDTIENEKFNILDEIKEIKIPGILQATLSIAISNEGDSHYEKYKSAKAALDIVLGRGGDQAIVRKNGRYSFYGGRAQEVEKRTKVKARIIAQALEDLMKESSNVMIMGHNNSDMDSLGSSLGLYRLARDIGKEAYIINNTYGIGIENFIKVAMQNEEYQNYIIDKAEALAKITPDTLLIIVDTHKKNYVEIPELLEETKKIVIIDHHRRSTDYIEEAILTFHEVYASSTAELVTELLEYAQTNIHLTPIEVEALYAGIMIDTKDFTFKTGVRTFEAAAFLRKLGVDIIRVKKWFQDDLKMYNTISKIVAKAEMIYDTIAISLYEGEEKDANIICAKAADELLTISGISASFVIGKLENKICISGRSIGDINVQVILEKLGGGGHITLAGAQVEGMNMEEVKQELINRIHEYFSEMN